MVEARRGMQNVVVEAECGVKNVVSEIRLREDKGAKEKSWLRGTNWIAAKLEFLCEKELERRGVCLMLQLGFLFSIYDFILLQSTYNLITI